MTGPAGLFTERDRLLVEAAIRSLVSRGDTAWAEAIRALLATHDQLLEQRAEHHWFKEYKACADLLDAASARVAALEAALRPAIAALRSYQYGNGATDLAKEVADKCQSALAASAGEGK